MIGIAKTNEDDERNPFGYPRELLNLIKTQGPVTAQTDQSIGKNDALPWVVLVAIVSCSLSGVGLGLGIGARDVANKAERESRLQRLEIDEMKVALQTQGIKIHEGSKP